MASSNVVSTRAVLIDAILLGLSVPFYVVGWCVGVLVLACVFLWAAVVTGYEAGRGKR